MDLLERIKEFIVAQGAYCNAQEIRRNTGISLYAMYSLPEFSVLDLNRSLGFEKPKKIEHGEYERRIRDYIRSVNRFVSALEIANNLAISRSSFRLYNLDIDELNESEGFNRGYPKQRNDHNKLSEEYIESVRSRMKIILEDGYIPEHTMYQRLEMTKGGLGKYIDYKKLIAECGLEDQGLKRFGSTKDMLSKIHAFITAASRYCPCRVLAEHLGVTENVLDFRGLDIATINLEHGYVRDNGYFEHEVGQALAQLFPGSTISRQKYFRDMLSPDGNLMFLDFYIEEFGIGVEADGPGHHDPRHPWYSEKGLVRDRIKNAYFLEINRLLIRVPQLNNEEGSVAYVKSCFPKDYVWPLQ